MPCAQNPNDLIKFHDSLGEKDKKIFQIGIVGMTEDLAKGRDLLEESGTNHFERSRILHKLALIENKVHAEERKMFQQCFQAHRTAYAVANAILKKWAAHHQITREQMEQMAVAAAKKVEAAKKTAEATAKQLEVTATKTEEKKKKKEKKLQSTIKFLQRRVNQLSEEDIAIDIAI